jgi:hypothetical protein
MRKFAVVPDLAIPVDEIVSISFLEQKTLSGLLFDMKTLPARMKIEVDNGQDRYIEDAERAKMFIRSLESSTDIQGAYADDLERGIEKHLEKTEA